MTVSITTTPLVDHAAYVQMCECGQGPRIGGKQSGCKRCERIDRERYAVKDGLTADVRRLLHHHYPDWLDGTEIIALVNNEDASSILWLMRRDGLVERRKEHRSGYAYRLTRRAA